MNSNNPTTSTRPLQTEKCPKCGTTMTPEGICESCGWALINYPAVIPDALRAFEESRSRAAEKIKSNRQSLNDQTTNLRNEKQRLDSKVADLERELDDARASNAQSASVSAERDRLRNERETLNQRVADLERQLGDARHSATNATPRAILILTNENDADDLSAVAIGSGVTRVGNARVARNNPSFSGQILSMMTSVEVDFSIELSQSGRFRVKDNVGTLLLNRVPVGSKATQITNGDTLTFEGIKGISLKFSIPRSR